MTETKGASLRKLLRAQGRTVTWLARTMGYQRSYVSSVLNGNPATPMTEEFQRRAAKALGTEPVVIELFKGKTIRVPESIHRRAVEQFQNGATAADAYEAAWKEAWLREHGADVLATEAERAWQHALGGLGRMSLHPDLPGAGDRPSSAPPAPGLPE